MKNLINQEREGARTKWKYSKW